MSLVDLVLRDGLVVDGTGNPWRRGDVVVDGGRIVQVVPAGTAPPARRVLDASGHVVAPGFIDIHAHSDLAVLARPGAEVKLRQGITTEVVGNCGISVAPGATRFAADLHAYASPILGFEDLEWRWSDVAGYLDAVQRAHPAVNVATYVGLGTVRCAVTGFRESAPTADERAEMVALVRTAMSQGAVGVSSGLVYAPGSYASREEIVEQVAESARWGGLYSSHMRDQGDGFLASVEETIDVGRRSGAAVLIAHHKVVGRNNWGKTSASLRLLDAARADGIDAGSDVYPYLAGSTTMTALLPDWALAGGQPAMLDRLVDRSARARIRMDWRTGRPGWDNRIASLGLDNIRIAHVATARNSDLVGLSVKEAAERRGRPDDPEEFLLDLLVEEEGRVGNVQMACAEEDLRRVLIHSATSFGSDGLYAGQKPHPRLHGAFPRILGEYVRDQQVLSLEDAVRRMTSLTARRLGLAGIGLLEPGYRADITVFDPGRVGGPATYDEPELPPTGIRWVVVGGEIAVEDEVPTGARAGVPLTRTAYQPQRRQPQETERRKELIR